VEAQAQMNSKRLIFWAALFCALLGYVVVFQKSAPRKETTNAQLVKVFSFPADSIEKIVLRTGTKTSELVKKDNRWEIASPAHLNPNQDTIDSLLSTITGLIKIEVVSEDPKDLRQYGLENPDSSVTLYRGSDATPVVLDIGSDTPTGVSMYARLRGSNEVIQVGTLLRFSIKSFLEMQTRSVAR
jgi:hypothetical protein